MQPAMPALALRAWMEVSAPGIHASPQRKQGNQAARDGSASMPTVAWRASARWHEPGPPGLAPRVMLLTRISLARASGLDGSQRARDSCKPAAQARESAVHSPGARISLARASGLDGIPPVIPGSTRHRRTSTAARAAARPAGTRANAQATSRRSRSAARTAGSTTACRRPRRTGARPRATGPRAASAA